MKKQNKTKIKLEKINVARLDKEIKGSVKGGTFVVCGNGQDTGSVPTGIIFCNNSGDGICRETGGINCD
ncbi:hypothetical protein [Aquimarina spongiae]|uniref:Uncharacterized protein n=1 Tax=Aquimarina spongiae TaxID=570521 RepID=A0A1M6LID2_9FLAO|nr:hypothetical protein [Aquimarina spongiae]SHJ70954.1 hypothetical protein SAMN04488508_11715 [Aquimarina spongiae]